MTPVPRVERPVFIHGTGRCGSTWLQGVLNESRDLHIHGQFPPGDQAAHMARAFHECFAWGLHQASGSNGNPKLPYPHFGGSTQAQVLRQWRRLMRDWLSGFQEIQVAKAPRCWGLKALSLGIGDNLSEFLDRLWPDRIQIMVIRHIIPCYESNVNTFARGSTVAGFAGLWLKLARYALDRPSQVQRFHVDRGELQDREVVVMRVFEELGLRDSVGPCLEALRTLKPIHDRASVTQTRRSVSEKEAAELLDFPGVRETLAELGYSKYEG